MVGTRASFRARLAAAFVLVGVVSLGSSVAIAGTPIISGSDPLGTSHGLDYRQATSSGVVALSTGAAAAYCPQGKRLTGGGTTWNGTIDDAYIDDSGPLAFDGRPATKQWTGSGYNRAGADKDMNAFAICAEGGGLSLESRQIGPVPATTLRDPRVRCPGGSKVTGGGVVLKPSDQSQILLTRPWDSGDQGHRPEDGWEVRLYVNVATEQDDVTVYAICSTNLDLRYERSTSGPIFDGQSAGVGANCRASESTTGGGAALTGAEGAFLNGVEPKDRDPDGNSVPDDQFYAYAHADTGGVRSLRAYAVCKT